MKLVSVAEMRAIEMEAEQRGVSAEQMMKIAGLGLAEAVLDLIAEGYESQPVVLGLVGTGNNGGDTLVALTELAKVGWRGLAYLVGARGDSDPLLTGLLHAGGSVKLAQEDVGFGELDAWLAEAMILLDGVVGTGLKLPLKTDAAEVLGYIAQRVDVPLIIAVDCPSGVDCETGEVAPEAIQADLTVCMAAVKQGLLRMPAYEKVGQIMTVQIGLPDDLDSWKSIQYFVATAGDIREHLPARPLDAYKGSFGKALIVAGSINFTGAAWLSAAAAYRVGAGLVRLAVPAPLHGALAGHLPEATWLILPHEMGVISEAAAEVLLKNLEASDSLLIGPGLGSEDTTGNFLRRVLHGEGLHATHGSMGFRTSQKSNSETPTSGSLPPMVIDADGLRLMAKINEWWSLLPESTVLTPHPGEMAVLTGLSIAEIQADREGIAAQFSRKWNCTVVLKGAFSVIAGACGAVTVIPVATAALAKAGSGDVLAGMIVGLIAQGMDSYSAAVAAAWLHAQAGLQAEEDMEGSAAVMASDILDEIPVILGRLSTD